MYNFTINVDVYYFSIEEESYALLEQMQIEPWLRRQNCLKERMHDGRGNEAKSNKAKKTHC